jgi:HEAT repeat protein
MKDLSYRIVMPFLVIFAGCAGKEAAPVLAGGREVKWWLEQLRDPRPGVRRQAVLKLGNVGDADPAVAGGLAVALQDADGLVRRDAVLAVAKLKSPSDALIAKLGIMSRGDREASVRELAERALAKLGRID